MDDDQLQLAQAQQFAKQHLEDMLTFFGLNIRVDTDIEDEVINLNVPTTTLNGFLIGERGATLRSIQHLVNLAVSNQGYRQARISVDIADYKKQRAERLAEQVKQWAEAVQKMKSPMELSPMNAADRRTVHKTVAQYPELETTSEGQGRDRHVVIRLKGNA